MVHNVTGWCSISTKRSRRSVHEVRTVPPVSWLIAPGREPCNKPVNGHLSFPSVSSTNIFTHFCCHFLLPPTSEICKSGIISELLFLSLTPSYPLVCLALWPSPTILLLVLLLHHLKVKGESSCFTPTEVLKHTSAAFYFNKGVWKFEAYCLSSGQCVCSALCAKILGSENPLMNVRFICINNEVDCGRVFIISYTLLPFAHSTTSLQNVQPGLCALM